MQRRSFLSAIAAVLIPLRPSSGSGSTIVLPRQVRTPEPMPRLWSTDELERLLDVCREDAWSPPTPDHTAGISRADWWMAFILLRSDTAARIGELLQVSAADVELDARQLTLSAAASKLNANRMFLLSKRTINHLRLTSEQRIASSLLLPWTGHRATLHKHWRKILAAAGMPIAMGRCR
jgi:integrase